jgi:hypothetical protein
MYALLKSNLPLRWSAVVRGAVREKVDPVGNSLVQLRLCRRHYGASLQEPYDEAKHKDYSEGDKSLDSKSGIVFAKGMSLFGCHEPRP